MAAEHFVDDGGFARTTGRGDDDDHVESSELKVKMVSAVAGNRR